eukprot:jgi/Phyca11/19191/fgenesh1_pg.PHYCAscaffold_46_\
MSDTFATRSSNVPSSSSAGNASGDAPASATASSLQGGGDGTAVSPGGSSSAPTQAPASPRDTTATIRNDDPVVAAHEVPHMKRLKSEMQDLKTRYQDHIDSLETDKAELKARLTDAEAHIRLLNDRPVTKAIDTWGFAEFLQKNADVSGNWDRLHELLELYQDNATVPSSWDTVINITSLDKRRDPVPDFKEAFDKAAAASKVTATEKPPVVLDLTRPGTSSKSGKSPLKSSKASSGKQPQAKSTGKSKSQKKLSPPKIQRRPSRHTPGNDSVRKAGEKTSVPKKSAHTMLPGNVVWKELVKMLISMMYWRRWDTTP